MITLGSHSAPSLMLALAALVFVPERPATAQALTGSYRRVLSPKDRRQYYDSNGRSHLGSLVHLHVRLSVFDREAARGTAERPGDLAEYADRSVPILVSRGSDYLAQLNRKHRERSGGEICVKGRIVSPSWAKAGKCYLMAHTLKRAPKRE